ncbi:hypothetical protein M9980_10865 [Sphingomonas donggukensis]|uniref:Uncharacterized protein n=1 Tax=Sphingomonas donggukensis TaxID=2949093 RepID=A0ABY4TRN5_9SPHN|nr:hypothetical protein [Sphingomonas donggukensis]URW75056.1 hypothetical protein M9980_10865 [Sphingomonas donggukensis]
MGFVATHWRATKVRAELGDRVLPVVGTPVSQVVMRSPRPDHFHDPEEPALRSRIRKIVRDADIDGDKLVPMATMFRAEGGGPLRTFNGGLAHENGWIPSRKARRLLHWEGEAQRALVVRCESDFAVDQVATESVGLTIPFVVASSTIPPTLRPSAPTERQRCGK